MTDNDIIKALECCIKSSHFGECFENKCPLVSEEGCKVGKETLYPYAFDLINRQKAEIERLANSLAIAKKETKRYITSYKTAKAEAVTEFAERLKQEDGERNHIFDDCASILVSNEYRQGREEKVKEIWETIDKKDGVGE